MRDLGFDLDCFPRQLGEDFLTEQNVLSRFKLQMPRLGTWAEKKKEVRSSRREGCEKMMIQNKRQFRDDTHIKLPVNDPALQV